MSSVEVVRTVQELRRKVAGWRAASEKVALVPTMGALHEGHLQLVRVGQRRAKRCVVSIFVIARLSVSIVKRTLSPGLTVFSSELALTLNPILMASINPLISPCSTMIS